MDAPNKLQGVPFGRDGRRKSAPVDNVLATLGGLLGQALKKKTLLTTPITLLLPVVPSKLSAQNNVGTERKRMIKRNEFDWPLFRLRLCHFYCLKAICSRAIFFLLLFKCSLDFLEVN